MAIGSLGKFAESNEMQNRRDEKIGWQLSDMMIIQEIIVFIYVHL